MKPNNRISLAAVIAVFLVVCLNLFGAWVLEKATEFEALSIIVFMLIGLVIFVNIGRFLLWGWMHKRIDLSKSYPLTAMFFPLVALLSMFNGERILPIQWVGILLITVGVLWFSIFINDNSGQEKS